MFNKLQDEVGSPYEIIRPRVPPHSERASIGEGATLDRIRISFALLFDVRENLNPSPHSGLLSSLISNTISILSNLVPNIDF